jgi:pimeloyl-ACP methyl ester carboxylesterase
MKNDIGIVLIHGAGLGGWIWSETGKHLETDYLAVNFPDREHSAVSKSLSLKDYCDHLSEQISGWNKPRLVLAAHSIGGVPALMLANELGERVSGIIGISSSIPVNGGSFLSTLPVPKRLLFSAILRIAGTKPPESVITGSLCSDLPEPLAKQVAGSFVEESVRIYFDRCNAPIPDVPTLYIKCAGDKEFSDSMQNRMADNLGAREVVSLDSGHIPMLSKPQELAELMNRFTESLPLEERTVTI